MANYGEYNGNLVIDENKDSLDTKTTKGTTAIKKAVIGNYTSSEMKKGPYVGYILKTFTIEKDEQEKDLLDAALDLFSSSDTITAYKVRIPEIDCHIPEPDYTSSAEEDILYVDMHPTYFLSKGMKDKLEKGNKVLVEIDETDQNKNLIIEALGEPKQQPASSPSSKKAFKNAQGNRQGNGVEATAQNPLPTDASELEKWNAYSFNSGNPRNIDIITKTVNGQKITLSRPTMSKYETFVDMWTQKRNEIVNAGLGDPGDIKYIFGEAFRVWKGETGNQQQSNKFKSGLKGSIHNSGGAIDLRWNYKYNSNPHRKYTANYVNLIIHCAQLSGFIRFGIGGTIVHIDTGVSVGAPLKNASWWVYRNGKHTSKVDDKKATYRAGVISSDWIDNLYTPPNLKNFDYLSVRYGPSVGV